MGSFFKVTDRQWFGLILSIIISMLWWWELVFITHKDEDEMKITKMQWCGLGIGIIIGSLGWFKTVNIVDK
tara:strand:+ start:565 stop:777 length:213 start_codon:yes stop_codon:yes gene_type:complete